MARYFKVHCLKRIANRTICLVYCQLQITDQSVINKTISRWIIKLMIRNRRFFYSALLWLWGFKSYFNPFIWHSIIYLIVSSYQALFQVLAIPGLMMLMPSQFRKLLAVFNLLLVLLVPGSFFLAIPPNLSIFLIYKNRTVMSSVSTLQCEEWLTNLWNNLWNTVKGISTLFTWK